MYAARVVGTVTANIKAKGLKGYKLLLIQNLDKNNNLLSAVTVAMDNMQAGEGDTVLVVHEEQAAQQILQSKNLLPMRSLIVGIIDHPSES